MNVLLNISGSPDLDAVRGGAIERIVANQVEYLAEVWDITVFGQLSPLNERVRVAPFAKRMNLNWKSMPGNLAFMAQGLPKILKVNADVIVSAHPRAYFLSLLYAKRRRKPLVSWELDHDQWVPPWTAMKRLYQRGVSKADLVMTISAEQQRWIVARGIAPEKIVPINGTVDTEKYRPSAQRTGKPYLLYVAKFHPRKNQVALIEAFSEMAQAYGDLELVLVGPKSGAFTASRRDKGSEYYLHCMELIRSRELEEKISVLEDVSEKELIRLYQGCTVFVFPSLEEGFGLTLLEAMSCGCACISNDIEPMREVLGEAGLLIDCGDSAAITAGIRRLLEDDGKRESLGRLARQRATSRFDPETIHRRFAEEISKLSPQA